MAGLKTMKLWVDPRTGKKSGCFYADGRFTKRGIKRVNQRKRELLKEVSKQELTDIQKKLIY